MKKTLPSLCLAVFSATMFVASLPAAAQPSCTFTLFQVSTYSTLPNRIDRYGTVVGYAYNPGGVSIGFIRNANGTITQYSAPNSSGTELNDRNSNGEMVGTFQDTTSSQTSHGFILQNSTFTEVDYPGASSTSLTGINDAGAMVGLYTDSSGNYVGFQLKNGVYTTVAYPGATSTLPAAINNLGEVTGAFTSSNGFDNGFTLINGTYTELNDPSGTSGTYLEGSNARGKIVGTAQVSLTVPTQGFLYSDGTFTNIVVPNASFDTANGINRNGVITGAASFSDGYHGYIAHCQ